jgi:DNA-binding response OmpR family regulator
MIKMTKFKVLIRRKFKPDKAYMSKIKILWTDDEIDLLKPHIRFLTQKGYEVVALTSGNDAVEEISKQNFDVIILDEKMPGLSGIETLGQIKKIKAEIPVIMVTKMEDEILMEDAIGSQISDYLIKPVNPNQLLMSIKKLVDSKRLVSEKITTQYQKEFAEISMMVNDSLNFEDWKNVYKKIIRWELELEKSSESNMKEIFVTQKNEANNNFFKFIQKNYYKWLKDPDSSPLLSNKLLVRKVLPQTLHSKPVYFILIDNFRYDQWKSIQPLITEHFRITEDDLYYSILPTATSYARNAIFSGLMPSEIEKNYPKLWVYDDEEGLKNENEDKYFEDYLKRLRKILKYSYEKIKSLDAGKKLPDNVTNYAGNDLSIIVYNFIDLLSHSRTEMEVIKELAEDETAYRSITYSWFKHSPLYEFLIKLSTTECKIIISTDHGSISVKRPSRVIGDKNTTTNLRYKYGKNLNFQPKEVFHIKDPEEFYLPKPNVSTSYIFAKDDFYFIYPNNYNYYVNFFNNSFQHGGISLEEMLIPVITLENK